MKKKTKNRKLAYASEMPPLYHTLPGQPYSQKESEVLRWLSERPMLIEYVFDQANNAKEILYNPKTGKWQGVDFND